MSELYWLGVLGNLHDFGEVVVVLSILALCVLGFWTITFGSDYDEPFKKIKRKFKCSIYALVFGATICLFIPSTKSLLIIYGVGGTIDYVRENKDANKIPNKCVKALDKYLDDALKEDKDKDKE
jgi:hypothetical protein